MNAKKEYMVRINHRTEEYLVNEEVFCRDCGKNFGNIYILQKHRKSSESGDSICLDPLEVGMTAHVNRKLSTIWKYSKW